MLSWSNTLSDLGNGAMPRLKRSGSDCIAFEPTEQDNPKQDATETPEQDHPRPFMIGCHYCL